MKFKNIAASVLVFVLSLSLLMGIASAQTFRSGDNQTVEQDEVIDASLWTKGKNITVAGEVNGDVFCLGQNVTISGAVSGDVICGAQNIRISGVVEGDLRLAAQTLIISGTVERSASLTAQTVIIENGAVIGDDVSIAANTVTVDGTVGRDLALTADIATLSGEVGQTLKSSLTQLIVADTAQVDGDLTYTSANQADIASGAEISGETVQYQPPEDSGRSYGTLFAFSLSSAAYFVLALLLTALVLVFIFPQAFRRVSDLSLDAPFKTLLIGLAAGIAIPVLIVSLSMTLIGIPLALFILLAWLIIIGLSGPFFGYYIGRLVLSKEANQIKIMAAGSIIVLLLYLIPIVGLIVALLAFWMGTGMVLRAAKHHLPKPSYRQK